MVLEKRSKYFNFDDNFIIKEEINNFLIFIEELNILKIEIIEKSSEFFFNILFNVNVELITPKYSLKNNQYDIDYSQFNDKDFELIELSNFIIKLKDYFIIIQVDFSNDLSFKINDKENLNIIFKFSESGKFKINFKYISNLNKFYKNQNSINNLPIWIYGLNVIIDYKKTKDSNVNFTDLKRKIENNLLNVLITNWESENNLLINNKNIESFNSLINKLKLNKINYIFQYDSTVPDNENNKFPVLRTRSGGVSLNNNKRAYIDFYNATGKNSLKNFFENILNFNSSGIYLNPLIFKMNDKDDYYKSVCKTESQLVVYHKNIKFGFKIINDILKELKKKNDVIFFTNVFNKQLNNTVFLNNINNNDINCILFLLLEIFYQGYYNFGFYIQSDNFNLLNNTHLKVLLILLICPFVFIDHHVILEISQNNESNIQFLNIIKNRISLRIFLDNLFIDFIDNGRLPFLPLVHDNIINGIFMGDNLFISFLFNRIFDSLYKIPDGVWYSIIDKIIIKGNSSFVDRENKYLFKILLKKDNVLLYSNDSNFSEYLSCNKMTIYIYPGIESKKNSFIINERFLQNNICEIITHAISYNIKNNIFNIVYKSNKLLKRKITFHIVTDEIKIDNIYIDDKKVLFYKDKNNNYIDFQLLNDNDCENIIIHLSTLS